MSNERTPLGAQYKLCYEELADYFWRYGGVRSILLSPYPLASAIVTGLCWGTWRASGWTAYPLEVLPALLGFSLAAFALLFAFGDESFRTFLAKDDKAAKPGEPIPENNVLLGLTAIYLHFIVIQVLALLMAVIADAHPLTTFLGPTASRNGVLPVLRNIYSAFGFFAFIWSLAAALAAALNIYVSTKWYIWHKGSDTK